MKRTILRSSKGTKLYAKRKANRRFADIQTYKRAHSADMRKTSASEKRRKLLEYIVNFHVQADNQFNEAWRKLIQGIDGLKLF